MVPCMLQVNDGSTLSGLQVVVQPEVPGYDLLENGTVNTGAAVRVQGELVESPGRNQKVCTALHCTCLDAVHCVIKLGYFVTAVWLFSSMCCSCCC